MISGIQWWEWAFLLAIFSSSIGAIALWGCFLHSLGGTDDSNDG